MILIKFETELCTLAALRTRELFYPLIIMKVYYKTFMGFQNNSPTDNEFLVLKPDFTTKKPTLLAPPFANPGKTLHL